LEVKKEASIASEVLPSGSLFYLVFGPYGTQSEARQTNMMLTLRGFDSTIVRAPNSTAYEVVLGGQDSFALMESSSRKIAAINGEVGKVLPRVRDAVEQTARN
jgi:cell division protein FtsN